MEDGTRKRLARRWTCWRSRSTSEPVATSRRRRRGAAVLDTAVPRPCVIGRASWRRRQQSRFARGKLDPRREPPLHVRASANPDLARADRLLGSRRFQHSELAMAAFVGFCIVADTGLVAALPLCLSAGPKQKSLTVADRAATRLLVRGCGSLILRSCTRAPSAIPDPCEAACLSWPNAGRLADARITDCFAIPIGIARSAVARLARGAKLSIRGDHIGVPGRGAE